MVVNLRSQRRSGSRRREDHQRDLSDRVRRAEEEALGAGWYRVRSALGGPIPYLGGPGAVGPAKAADEVGQISKAGVKRHRSNAAVRQIRVDQHAVGSGKPLAKHELGKGGALALEQHLDV